jgi:chromate transporter
VWKRHHKWSADGDRLFTELLADALTLLVLSAVYAGFGDTTLVTAVFAGLAPAVVAIVAQAVWRVGSRALTRPILV